jgi:regulator of replication initiation timing
MEVDELGLGAGQAGMAPPALSTRAQFRRVTKENSRTLRAKSPEVDLKVDVILKTLVNLHTTAKQLQEGQDSMKQQIDELKQQNEEMKTQNNDLRAQNESFQIEIHKLQEQIVNLSMQNTPQSRPGSSPSPAETRDSNRSWSSLFTNQSTVSSSSSASRQRNANPDRLLGVNIDLSKCRSPVPEDTADIMNLVTIALQAHQATKDVKPTAIMKTNRDLHRMRIIVRSETEADLIRMHPQWLETHFSGGRLRGEQWYPVKVDRVDKLKIMNDERTQVKEGLEQQLSEENEVRIMKIATLGKPATHKLYCSMVVYLKKKEDAEKLLNDRIMTIGAEAGFTSAYEYRPRVTRCFNCQEYGHQAYRCQKDQRCLRCSEAGHATCATDSPRCVSCQGPHAADDRGCPVYREQLKRLNPGNG